MDFRREKGIEGGGRDGFDVAWIRLIEAESFSLRPFPTIGHKTHSQ